ncbi:Colicin V production, CvpA [Syntrophomonas zehnderi OL-4]|uniref:Colicin V production, CvpA n=2 Tax=Syntrophomonas TaxID=862 RepID=A0A0E4C7F7_9FIRM|nr:Colicin V production, CvpA [Syntrophomonas zehnderi OL-4]
MNAFDYMLLALLGISALKGYNRGFLSVLVRFASTLVALCAAFFFRHDLAGYLEKQFGLKTMLAQAVADKFPQPSWGDLKSPDLLPSLKSLPIIQAQLDYFAELVVVVVSFILLYIIISKGLRIIWKLMESPWRQGLLGKINRLAGLLLLVLKDLLIIAVLLGILYPFVQSGAKIGLSGFVNTKIWLDQSYLLPYIMDIFAGLETLLKPGA